MTRSLKLGLAQFVSALTGVLASLSSADAQVRLRQLELAAIVKEELTVIITEGQRNPPGNLRFQKGEKPDWRLLLRQQGFVPPHWRLHFPRESTFKQSA